MTIPDDGRNWIDVKTDLLTSETTIVDQPEGIRPMGRYWNEHKVEFILRENARLRGKLDEITAVAFDIRLSPDDRLEAIRFVSATRRI